VTPLPPDAGPPESWQFRRAFRVGVLLFSAFLVVRTAMLEPFGVPTGSMAPALLGNHRTVNCPRCDAPVTVGEPGPDARPIRFDACRCTNCGEPVDLSDAREIPGDRLLVDKLVYQARDPRRWEVAVFRCPADLSKPYVKRVVGLPGERVTLRDGDVYADGHLRRKSLRQLREIWVPVFSIDHAPEGGWHERFRVTPPDGPERPADATVLSDNVLTLTDTAVTYLNWNLDTGRDEPVGDFLEYNGHPPARRQFARSATAPWGEPAHDLAVSFDLEVVAGSGVFACRLTDGTDSVRADIPVGGQRSGEILVVQREGETGGSGLDHFTLTEGTTHRVEFAFVDRRASLAIDGRELVAPLDLPDTSDRGGKRQTARPVQFGVDGATVRVKHFTIRRDVHYTTAGVTEWQLAAGEYFVLGDNTASSFDSRAWDVEGVPTPGVPRGAFLGKPFLIHQPMRPARLTVNGRERRIQSPDWDRVRWLR
jgi:signal peptidase I